MGSGPSGLRPRGQPGAGEEQPGDQAGGRQDDGGECGGRQQQDQDPGHRALHHHPPQRVRQVYINSLLENCYCLALCD